MDIENEQRLKLSTSNIIALTAVLTFIGGYINIKSTQTEFNQRITALERQMMKLRRVFKV
jgi:hypothetical protein